MTGRGAWPVSGAGGTKGANKVRQGPYYCAGIRVQDGFKSDDPNERAVHGAVLAYQRALNRRLPGTPCVVDGWFGEQTGEALVNFQRAVKLVDDGLLGPTTSRALLIPDAKRVCRNKKFDDWYIVTGVIYHESTWDAGAVGYADERDVGLAQINAGAHPDLSEKERLQPMTSFRFVIDYLNNALGALDGVVTDAIASYNLGIGGAGRWIRQGRPEWYIPLGSTKARNVRAYIDSIINAPR